MPAAVRTPGALASPRAAVPSVPGLPAAAAVSAALAPAAAAADPRAALAGQPAAVSHAHACALAPDAEEAAASLALEALTGPAPQGAHIRTWRLEQMGRAHAASRALSARARERRVDAAALAAEVSLVHDGLRGVVSALDEREAELFAAFAPVLRAKREREAELRAEAAEAALEGARRRPCADGGGGAQPAQLGGVE